MRLPRPLVRGLACLAATALGAAALGAAVPGAVAAGTTASGPVLFGGGWSSYLQDVKTGTRTPMPGEAFSLPAQFSPSGAQLATLSVGCSGDGCTPATHVQVVGTDGVRDTVATLPGDGGWSVTWSPDGSQLAVLLNNNDGSAKIVLVDVATGAVVTLVNTTNAFRVEGYSAISWNPTNDEVAFVGSELSGTGNDYAVDASQLYTVHATTKVQARFNPHGSRTCSAPSACPITTFSDPDWSPDGTRLAVLADYDPDSLDVASTAPNTFGVGTIARGAAKATFSATYDMGSTYAGPFWSPDGTQLLFARDVGDDFVGGVVPVAGGAINDLESPYFLDWQPCPGGTCAAWGTAPTKVDSTVTLNYTVMSSVRTNGQVSPNRAGQKVTVTLQKERRGDWVTVAKKSQVLSAKSRYVIKFPLQNVFSCRAVARYAGDAKTKPATSVKEFSC